MNHIDPRKHIWVEDLPDFLRQLELRPSLTTYGNVDLWLGHPGTRPWFGRYISPDFGFAWCFIPIRYMPGVDPYEQLLRQINRLRVEWPEFHARASAFSLLYQHP